MGIPFDFKIFANELGKATDTLASGILHRWETKEKERIWKDQQGFLTKQRKEIKIADDKRRQKQKKDYFHYTESLKDFGERYGGDHTIAMWALGKHTSVNPQDRALGKFTDELYATIGMDKDITPEQAEWMQLLPPHITTTLTLKAMERKKEREKQLRTEAKDEIDLKKKKFDLEEAGRKRADIETGKIDAKKKAFEVGLEDWKKKERVANKNIDSATTKLFDKIDDDLWKTIKKKKVTDEAGKEWKIKDLEKINKLGRINPLVRQIMIRYDPALVPFFNRVDRVWEEREEIEKGMKVYGGEEVKEEVKIEMAGTIEEYRIPKGTQVYTTPDGTEVVKRGGKYYRIIK